MISINPLFNGSANLFDAFSQKKSGAHTSSNALASPANPFSSAINAGQRESQAEESFTKQLVQTILQAQKKTDTAQTNRKESLESLEGIEEEASSSVDTSKRNQAKKLWDASLALESLFVYKMFQVMRKANLQGDSIVQANHAQKIFEDFLIAEQSQTAVQSQSAFQDTLASKGQSKDTRGDDTHTHISTDIPKKPRSPFGLASAIYQQNSSSLFLKNSP